MKPGDLVRESSNLVLPQYSRIGLVIRSEPMSNLVEVIWNDGRSASLRLKDNVELINDFNDLP
jgi:hypothetical protein